MGKATSHKGIGAKNARSASQPARKSAAEQQKGLSGTPAVLMAPRLVYIACVVVLCVLGLVMVYSSSSITAYSSEAYGNDPAYFLKHQAVIMLIGVVFCAIAAKVPPEFLSNIAVCWAIWGICTALLLAVDLGMGTTLLGADRSLSIAGVSIQPSEFSKIAVLMVAASLLQQRNKGLITGVRFTVEVLICVGITVVLLFKQPDMGTTIIMCVGILVLLYLGGVTVAPLIIGGAVIVGFLVAWLFIAQDYHLDRIYVWLDPEAEDYAYDDGYQSVQARLALGSGGLFGLGIGMGKQKYEYLPYAYNDFIYAVIGEEMGLVGALVVVLLFVAILAAGLCVARFASRTFDSVIAGSLTAMLCFQAFLNMACVVGSLPVTGKALPFISYGGSSILASLIIVGLVLNVSIHTKLDEEAERKRGEFWIIDGGAEAAQRMSAAGVSSPAPAESLRSRFRVIAGGQTTRDESRPRSSRGEREPYGEDYGYPRDARRGGSSVRTQRENETYGGGRGYTQSSNRFTSTRSISRGARPASTSSSREPFPWEEPRPSAKRSNGSAGSSGAGYSAPKRARKASSARGTSPQAARSTAYSEEELSRGRLRYSNPRRGGSTKDPRGSRGK